MSISIQIEGLENHHHCGLDPSGPIPRIGDTLSVGYEGYYKVVDVDWKLWNSNLAHRATVFIFVEKQEKDDAKD